MKRKITAVLLAVVLVLGFSLVPAASAMAVTLWDIDKSVSLSTADLGDHITFTVTGNAVSTPAMITDVWSSDLTYIPGTLDLTGASYSSYSISEHYFGALLSATGSFTITFDVQVTEVQATTVTVSDTATVHEKVGVIYEPRDSDTEYIDLEPYEGFEKWVVECSELDPYYVPMYTYVWWWVSIDVENILGDDIITMQDVMVWDRLGGDLELEEWLVSTGSLDTSRKTGKTQKQHLTWDLQGGLADDTSAYLWLAISTDINPGQGKKAVSVHEYTEAGEHELNSGAVLKFIDPDTGFQLSAHTPPIIVVAYEPVP